VCGESAPNDVAGEHGEGGWVVEDGLLPVRVLLEGGGAQAEAVVGRVELAVEPGGECVHLLLVLDVDLPLAHEVQLRHFHLSEVDVEDFALVGNHVVFAERVDERVGERNLLDAAHVEVLDLVPEVDAVLLLVVLDARDLHDGLVREHEAVRYQEAVARSQHGVEHGLLDQELAHPLGDDDVDLLLWSGQLLEVFDLSLHHVDLVFLIV